MLQKSFHSIKFRTEHSEGSHDERENVWRMYGTTGTTVTLLGSVNCLPHLTTPSRILHVFGPVGGQHRSFSNNKRARVHFQKH